MSAKVSGGLPSVTQARRRSCNVRIVLNQVPTDACIEWPGMIDRQGYGVIASKVTHLAHRYIYYGRERSTARGSHNRLPQRSYVHQREHVPVSTRLALLPNLP